MKEQEPNSPNGRTETPGLSGRAPNTGEAGETAQGQDAGGQSKLRKMLCCCQGAEQVGVCLQNYIAKSTHISCFPHFTLCVMFSTRALT